MRELSALMIPHSLRRCKGYAAQSPTTTMLNNQDAAGLWENKPGFSHSHHPPSLNGEIGRF